MEQKRSKKEAKKALLIFIICFYLIVGIVLCTLQIANKPKANVNNSNTEYYVGTVNLADNIQSLNTWDLFPTIVSVTFDPKEPTQGNVIANIHFNEWVQILNSDSRLEKIDSRNYRIEFEENDSYTISFKDWISHTGSFDIVVSWIDRESPIATVTYNTTSPTNQDVVAKFDFNEQVSILNNDLNIVQDKENENIYYITFPKNTNQVIRYVDLAGNENHTNIDISWIDKAAPKVNVSLNTTGYTNEDVVATLKFNKPTKILNKDLNYEKVDDFTYLVTFAENDIYLVEFEDWLGNKGSTKIEINCIDRDAPVVDVSYDITEETNQDVTATLTFDKDTIILNEDLAYTKVNDRTYTITFTENNKYTVEFADTIGNKSSTTVKVNNIDKVAPTVNVSYSTTEATNKDVIATLKFNKVTDIINDDLIYEKVDDKTYTITFTQNARYTVEFEDKLGNRSSKVVEVNNIDKKAPTVDVTLNASSNTRDDLIATLKFNKKTKLLNRDLSYEKVDDTTYLVTFTENSTYIIEFEDDFGNKGQVTIEITFIDKIAPTVDVDYSITEDTNQDVVATLKFNKDTIILNEDLVYEKIDDRTYTITFTENDKHVVKFADTLGNTSSTIVEVNYIDKVIPTVNVSYSTTENTNKDVIATLSFDKVVNILNEDLDYDKVDDKTYTITFTKNATYTVEFEDKLGNKSSKVVEVNNIDKVVPKVDVTLSTTSNTKEDLIATLKFDKKANITTSDLVYEKVNDTTYLVTFTENSTYIIEFEDDFGNKGQVTIEITFIDKIAPTVDVDYNITEDTNQDVVATLKFNKDTIILNEDLVYEKIDDRTYTITFTENDKHVVKFADTLGNTSSTIVEVNYIDKVIPTVNVSYSTTENTNKDVIATLSFDKVVNILNEDLTYDKVDDKTYTITFTKNYTYTVEFSDKLGNKSYTTLEVTCIDKEAPTVDVSYSNTETTNEDVIATLKFNEIANILNKNIEYEKLDNTTYLITFRKNSKYIIEYEDILGNKASTSVEVNNIDKEAPIVNVSYDIEEATNKDVIATLTFNEATNILNEDITYQKIDDKTYLIAFTQNNKYTIAFADALGNTSSTDIEVNYIDKEAPIVNISYDIEEATNKDVVATLTFDEITNILNEDLNYQKLSDKVYTITFTENGRYEIEFADKLGNKSSTIVEVTYIDKVAPIVNVSYDKTEATNEDVIATLTFDEITNILNKDLVYEKINDTTYKITFAKNDKHIVEFEDTLGNKSSIKVEVNYIDKDAPVIDVVYNTTEATNEDVTATLIFDEATSILSDIPYEKIDDRTYIIIFTENNKYTVEFADSLGNTSSTIVEVNNIDKEAPIVEVSYSITEATNKDVIATLTFNEATNILNDDIAYEKIDDKTYTITFTENNKYIVNFEDKLGNSGSTKVEVGYIDKVIPTVNVTLSETSLTNKDVIATLSFDKVVTILNEDLSYEKVDDKTYTVTFTNNSEFVIEFTDILGNKGTVTIEITFIDKDVPTVDVTYSTTEATNEDVIATLNFSEAITILNKDLEYEKINDKTYLIRFTENAEHNVEFVDVAGNKDSVKVATNNIDKVTPTVDVTYSTTEITNKDVIATLKFSEEVYILNKDLEFKKLNNTTYTITFAENDNHIIEFMDKAGNKESIYVEVGCIDKIAPTVNISYSTTEITNSDVTASLKFSEDVSILNKDIEIINNGENNYSIIFTTNNKYTIEFKDKAGNEGTAEVEVSCIDKETPIANITYSKTEPTNEDVTAYINFNEYVTITSDDIKLEKVDDYNYTVTFEQNATHTIKFVDLAGNEGTAEIKVTCIDKVTPEVDVTYSSKNITNQNVIVTLKFNEEVTILNEYLQYETTDNKKYTITFRQNGSLDVYFVDKAGNESSTYIEVTCIDKEVPTAEFEYSITEITEDTVTVTLIPSKEVTITNNYGNSTYTFDDNGEFTFEFVDKAGNVGSATAVVDWIRKKNILTLSYDITEATNQDVTVTLDCNNPITITNNNGSDSYTFTENGEFTFEFTNQYNESGTITTKVDWIDKEIPTAYFEYSITEDTTNPVTVTLIPSKDVTILNNNGDTTYVFTENGEFTFEFVDKVGNIGSATASISWIFDVPGVNILYDIMESTTKNVTATLVTDDGVLTILNNNGSDSYTFTENGEFTFEYIDQYGNQGTRTARVDWIKVIPPEPEEPVQEEFPAAPNVTEVIIPEINYTDYYYPNEETVPEGTDEQKEVEKPILPDKEVIKDKKEDEKEKEDKKHQLVMEKQDSSYMNDTEEKGNSNIAQVTGLVVATSSVISIIVLLLIIFL